MTHGRARSLPVSPARRPPPQLELLTEEEIVVLTHVAHGLTDSAIAALQVRSVTTIRTHIARLNKKLRPADDNQNPRVMLTRIAIGCGLVAVPKG